MSRQIIEAADAVVEGVEALLEVLEARTYTDLLNDPPKEATAVYELVGRYRFVVEQAVEQAPARPGRPARPVVYIAAPFAGHTLAEVAENTHRAEALNLYAIRRGYAPICVHSGALRGAYGRDTDAGDRKAALDVDRALLDVSGEVWALTRDDGTLSPGMLVELDHWSSTGRPPWTLNPWAGWSAEFERLNVLT